MKKLILMTLAACLFSAPVFAEEKKKDVKKTAEQTAEMQPDLRKILEKQAKSEDAAWDKSNKEYTEKCLAGVEKGKPVPPEKAVPTTDCYISSIDKNVKPVALNTHMVDDMTKEWKSLARKYSAKQVTHKEWIAGMQATQKKFAKARIQVILGLVEDAKKKAAAKK